MGRRTTSKCSLHKCVGLLVGIILGVCIGFWSRSLILSCTRSGALCCHGKRALSPNVNILQSSGVIADNTNRGLPEKKMGVPNAQTLERKAKLSKLPKNKNLLFIGVMTAKQYLDTRGRAVYETWAQQVPGKVMFFSSEGSVSSVNNLPVVALPGVDDSYPPQKKSFLMLKYMHDRYGDQYQWFMRADDDVYVKPAKLEELLRSLNSSKPLFIGQAGLGKKEELGQLNLDHAENYCMGGPGMLISRAALSMMVPHTSYCLQNLYTTHEDVEIGRCISKFAGVSCTWAFEMQKIFYQNHNEPNGWFTHDLRTADVLGATTLHPVKNHTYQYRLHNFLRQEQLQQLRHASLVLRRELRQMSELLSHDQSDVPDRLLRLGLEPSLMRHKPRDRSEVLDWDYLSSRVIYSAKTMSPKRAMEAPQKAALDDIILDVMQVINKNARQRGRTIEYKDILYGYRRVNPLHGADYMLDLLLVYKKHKGRRMTVPVRRHAYLQQTFTEVQFREEKDRAHHLPHTEHPTVQLNNPGEVRSTSTSLLQRLSRGLYRAAWGEPADDRNDQTQRPASSSNQPHTEDGSGVKEVIHFILPLSGRYETFLLFMENFESVCLALQHPERVALAVMLFSSDSGDDRSHDTIRYMNVLQQRYQDHDLRVVELSGSFSRGVALQRGADLYTNQSLLFLVDVDIYFNSAFLERVRRNVHLNRQVYFPVVFSLYDPRTTCTGHTCPGSTPTSQQVNDNGSWQKRYNYEDHHGYWRLFGYGISAMYRADLNRVGGFDMGIRGWGKEDVQLYEQFVAHNVTIFRAVDPGLIHIYHPIHCDTSLEDAQYRMCLGSKAATYGCHRHLAAIVLNTTEILHRGEQHPNPLPGVKSEGLNGDIDRIEERNGDSPPRDPDSYVADER